MTDRPPRMPTFPDAQLSDAQKTAVAAIVSGPRGRLVGPFIPLLRSPEFMLRLQHTGAYLRFDSSPSGFQNITAMKNRNAIT